jgi:phosphoribosylanthranilate isomerase
MWVKICGMTSPDAVEAAVAAGADAIGFVFAPSPRRIEPRRARELAAPARGRVACIAVTLHPDAALIEEILGVFGPDVLQTDAADLDALGLRGRCATLPVLRAGAPAPSPLPARVLFEGPRSGAGQTADWSAAAALARRCELVLAGGLDAANVAEAVRRVRPFGVDVSSGVESGPGVKSPRRISEFVHAARAAARETRAT